MPQERCLWAHPCVGCGDEVSGNVVICQTCFLRIPESTRQLISTTLTNIDQPSIAQVNWQGLQRAGKWLKDNPRPFDPTIEIRSPS